MRRLGWVASRPAEERKKPAAEEDRGGPDAHGAGGCWRRHGGGRRRARIWETGAKITNTPACVAGARKVFWNSVAAGGRARFAVR